MALTVGTRLGPYEILSALGAGGMGEVYKATDTNLKRSVAIKVLPASVADDADRLARFQREAEVLAALNHPNIAQIHGLEKSAGTTALVMELVEGPTLADRIAQGAIPIDEALPIAKQIAEALEAAHEQRIVHRDLKPANIKVRADGTVKVLDFGLAKAMEPADTMSASASMSPTITSPAMRTGAGMILGTAAYMSPEQARGKTVDKRADIWAFGCVLFEMLTGTRAFEGDGISETLARVIEREPAWNTLPSRLSPVLRTYLGRCLQKEPRQRIRDIGDVRLALEGAFETAVPATETRLPTPRYRRPLVALSALLVIGISIGVGIGFGVGWFRSRAQAWKGTLLSGPSVGFIPRISPDGKTLAFLAFVDGLTQVAVMNPDSGNWTVLTKDRNRGYVSRISWSLDGNRIYYNRFSDVPLGIYSVPALGGEERLILEDVNGAEPLTDGSLLVTKINRDRQMQIFHYWPGDGRLVALPGILRNTEYVPLRVFPNEARAVFWGRSLEQPASDPRSYLYLLDVANARVSRLETAIPIDTTPTAALPLAIMPDGRSIVVSVANGDLTQLVAIDLTVPSQTRTLVDVPQQVNQIDIGPDGSVYLNQFVRTPELWQFTTAGTGSKRLNVFPDLRLSNFGYVTNALVSPDGRTWISTSADNRRRLLVTTPRNELGPFVETQEETGGPLTLVGDDRVAFIIGSGDTRRIAIGSVQDGRILRRIQAVNAASITAMASSGETSTLYYVDAGTIWSVSANEDAPPRKIHSGDGVAIAADGHSLIVQLVENQGVRWLRTSLDGSMEQEISVKGEWRFTFSPVGPGAVGRDGRIVLPINVKDSWFWALAVLNPNTGDVERVPLPFQADPPFPGWTSDGQVITLAYGFNSSLWRFCVFRSIVNAHSVST